MEVSSWAEVLGKVARSSILGRSCLTKIRQHHSDIKSIKSYAVSLSLFAMTRSLSFHVCTRSQGKLRHDRGGKKAERGVGEKTG